MRAPIGAILVSVALPFGACDCETALGELPSPRAVLAHDGDEAPPLERLEVPFGAGLIGQGSSALLTLRNDGNARLDVERLTLTSDAELCPAASAAFAITAPSESAFVIERGGSIELTVTFSPTDGVPACALLVVESNDEKHPRLEALLTGQGDAAQLCTDRAVVDFGGVVVGDTGADEVVLTSCGTRPATLTSLSEDARFPPFEHDALALPLTLAPGEQLALPVRFSPSEPGRFALEDGTAAALNFLVEEGAQGYQILLVGEGLPVPACDLAAVPDVVNFGAIAAGQVATQSTFLRNLGALRCTLDAIAVREPASPFSVSVDGFSSGMTLDPGGVLEVTVSFTAPSASGSVHGSLDVTSDDPDSALLTIPLEANVPVEDGCQVEVTPASVNFGAVPPGTVRTRSVDVTNISSDPCLLRGVSLLPGTDPGFIESAPGFGLMLPGFTKTVSIVFRGTSAGSATGTMRIETSDVDTPDIDVPLVASTAPSGICVEPRHIDFGVTNGAATQDFTITACGSAPVQVTELLFTAPDAEIDLPAPPGAFTLQPGEQRSVSVRYQPVDDQGDTATLEVRSDDPASPEVPVRITGGPHIVPPEAGRYLYYWQIPNVIGGDVMQLPLQGDVEPTPFWGPRTGKSCAGCHSVSPDGAYVAVVETAQMRFVEATTGLELFLADAFLDPTFFSWNPDVHTTPPYQFAYSNGSDILIASLFDGPIGPLAGANDPAYIETMPSWGPDGKIAFVRGSASAQTQNGNNFGLSGPTDILLVDEAGGTPVPVAGASENGRASYYPAFSPDGVWLAFTESASAQSTTAATDAQLRLVRADNSGTVMDLAATNGTDGASSYATWSRDGAYLSFSSQRLGGAGDWDLYIAPIDGIAGVGEAALNLNDFGLGVINTSGFEHAAQWSP